MPIVNLNNIDIYYEDQGKGYPLILIGGLSSDHQAWKSTARYFSQFYRVITFDNRGVGQSSVPDYPYTTEMMAQDTLNLMDYLKIKKAYVLGHSMGGCIAQQIALLAPQKVTKLIIVCSRIKPSVLSNVILSTRLKLMEANLSPELFAEFMLPFLFSAHFLKSELQAQGFVQWAMQNKYPQTVMGFKHQLDAVKSHDISKQLDALTMPTLVIAGEDDILMPAHSAEAFADQLPNAQFELIPHCAHMPHVEQSKLFSALLLTFLEE